MPGNIKLLNALITLLADKPLSRISVRDLLRTASLSKSTFYRLFNDKNDFLLWVMHYLLNQFTNQSYANMTPKTFYLNYLGHYATNRRAFKAFVIEDHWTDFEQQLKTVGIEIYRQVFQPFILQPQVKTLLATYIVNADVAVAINWLKTDDSRTIDQLATEMARLTIAVLAVYNIDFQEILRHN